MSIEGTIEAAIAEDFPQCLFSADYLLLPGLREIYELKLARLEAAALSPSRLVDQAAYFYSIGGAPTRHFLTCTGETLKLPQYSSSRLKAFFANNPFRTGYATHGLFPYRGKFHPQMVRGILNAMGVARGDTVLDPMMGSGTMPVEAALMGIDSIGLDASPFCAFMTRTKAAALTMSLDRARTALQKAETTYKYFAGRFGVPIVDRARERPSDPELSRIMEEGERYVVAGRACGDGDTADTYALLLLAFLDAMGYFQRTAGKDPLELFRGILDRYLHACGKFQAVRQAHGFDLGRAQARCGDARVMDILPESIDGILCSPPYSFAIDYVDNDAFHLEVLGVDRRALAERMIGIRGGPKLADKLHCYVEDMRRVLGECFRVLRPGRYCAIVIGTNTNQLSKALKTTKEDLVGLHEILRGEAEPLGFAFAAEIGRVINGISNTMREEFILFLRKP